MGKNDDYTARYGGKISEGRQRRIDIFHKTLDICHTDPEIWTYKTPVYFHERNKNVLEGDIRWGLRNSKIYHDCAPISYSVTPKKTIEEAVAVHREDPSKSIAILNFASGRNPGGGVAHGTKPQEESICRCTDLYPTLNDIPCWEQYYTPNRNRKDTIYDDRLIWTSGVMVLKENDDDMVYFKPENRFRISVITAPAPNLRNNNIELVKVIDTIHRRISLVLESAIKHSEECDCLILGAWGCGAFKNPPNTVASAFKNQLKFYGKFIKEIRFAVYAPNPETDRTYQIFKEYLSNFVN